MIFREAKGRLVGLSITLVGLWGAGTGCTSGVGDAQGPDARLSFGDNVGAFRFGDGRPLDALTSALDGGVLGAGGSSDGGVRHPDAAVPPPDAGVPPLPPAPPPPVVRDPEVCDGLDNDGDGVPDNGFACVGGASRSCGAAGQIEWCNSFCSGWEKCGVYATRDADMFVHPPAAQYDCDYAPITQPWCVGVPQLFKPYARMEHSAAGGIWRLDLDYPGNPSGVGNNIALLDTIFGTPVGYGAWQLDAGFDVAACAQGPGGWIRVALVTWMLDQNPVDAEGTPIAYHNTADPEYGTSGYDMFYERDLYDSPAVLAWARPHPDFNHASRSTIQSLAQEIPLRAFNIGQWDYVIHLNHGNDIRAVFSPSSRVAAYVHHVADWNRVVFLTHYLAIETIAGTCTVLVSTLRLFQQP